jgi:hypothetical protein
MSERVNKITQGTLIPLALVLTLLAAVWGLATDRQKALGQIETHETRIISLEQQMKGISDSLGRIESKLGTSPKP